MAKRRQQTTGLPRTRTRKRVTETTEDSSQRGGLLSRGPQREYRSRAEREAEIQRYVLWGTAAAIVVVVLIVAAALIVDQVINPGRTVATVNGEDITVREFEERVRFERALNIELINAQIYNFADQAGVTIEDAANQTIQFEPYSTYWSELNARDQLGLRVLNDMIDDEIVRAEAEEMGITVTEEDIDAEFERVFGFDRSELELIAAEQTPEPSPEPTLTPTPLVSPTPSPEPTSTPAPEQTLEPSSTPFPTVPPPPTFTADEQLEQFDEVSDDFVSFARSESGFSREQIDNYFELQALRRAIAETLTDSVETETWVNTRHILVETEDEARDIIAAIQAGESFASLAAANGTDGTAQRGGELGWSAVSGYVEEFAEAVEDAPIGIVLEEPVQTQFGYHVIQVNAREEREAQEAAVEQNIEEAIETWLDEKRDSEEYDVETSSIWPDYVPDDPVWRFRER